MIPEFPSISETLTGPVVTVLFALAATPLLAITLYAVTARHLKQRVWQRFRNRAAALGLTRSHCRTAIRLAQHGRLKDPVSLLTLLGVYDRQVASFLKRNTGLNAAEDKKLLASISSLRRQLGFDTLKPHASMRTTRQMERGQRILVRPSGDEEREISCVVEKRNDRSITAAPISPKDRHRLRGLRRKDDLSVELHRGGDSEHRFATRVLEVDQQAGNLQIAHAEHVERLQLRTFFRIEASAPVTLLAMPMTPAQYRDMATEGVNWDLGEPIGGLITNISAGGMSVVTNDPQWQGEALVVDPQFYGPFPLAGLPCELVSEIRKGRKRTLRLRFFELEPSEEAGIVRSLHRTQAREQRTESGGGDEDMVAAAKQAPRRNTQTRRLAPLAAVR